MNLGFIVIVFIIVSGIVISAMSFYFIRKYASQPINGEVKKVAALKEKVRRHREIIEPVLIKYSSHEHL